MNRSLGALALFLFAGHAAVSAEAEPTLEAKLQPLQGSNVRGFVTFLRQGDGVQVSANVTGLAPGGHGFHIHEKGDCSAPDGTSAGGHFNPGGKPHGNPDQGEHHMGDMPMLQADADGNARLNARLNGVAVDGPDGIAGKAVIVHANADDFKTQPTGNSGGRVACGVISSK